MATVPAMSVRINASNPFDSSGEDFDPGFVDDTAQWYGYTQGVGEQQWDTQSAYQGGGEDNGYMPSEIPAEESSSSTRSRPVEADDGSATGRAGADSNTRGQASSSNVTNQQFEEPVFRDQGSGSSFYGRGTGEPERPQSYSGAGTGPESGCWNCGGDGLRVPYEGFMMTYDLASNYQNLQGCLHARDRELYTAKCELVDLKAKFEKSEGVQADLHDQLRQCKEVPQKQDERFNKFSLSSVKLSIPSMQLAL